MINITYQYNHNFIELTACGHAGYSTSGTDIVCAAVSALMQSYASFWEDFADIDSSEGYLSIRLNNGSMAEETFFMTINGLKAIAEQYPNNVSIRNISFEEESTKRVHI